MLGGRVGSSLTFSTLVDRAFTGSLIPLFGLVSFPYATLFYVLAYSPVTGLDGWAAPSWSSASSSTSGTGLVAV